MRFHLIDRIDVLEPGHRVIARKVTSATEEYWQATDGGPVMPAALVLEALCQAGTWLLLASTDQRRRAALLSVEHVSFLADVVPGDVVQLDGTVTAASDAATVLAGRATVDGRPVLTASGIMCALIDADELDDPAATARMSRQLMRQEPAR
jgi:3-hydroxyacyl-[acyl-carrier-protein] dehydratase